MTCIGMSCHICLSGRFLDKMFSGSFKGQVLYENPSYVSPNVLRADMKRGNSAKYTQKVKAKKRRKMHEENNRRAPDEFADLWQEQDESD